MRLAALLVFATGCGSPLVGEAPQLPGTSRDHTVAFVVERGPYLDALLARGGRTLRLLFPAADPGCRALVRTEATVRYVALGHFGQLQGPGDERCDPVGIANLAVWRDRRPRPDTGGEPVPRGTARFEVVYRDSEYALAEGRFPLTGLVGWPGGWDTLALVPNSEACRALLEAGEASIEYRPSGPEPYRLVTRAGLCPVDGFVRRIPGLR